MSITDEQTDEKSLVREELSKIILNPNVFTDFKLAGTQEVRIQTDFEKAHIPFFGNILVLFCDLEMNFAASDVGILDVLGGNNSSCLCFFFCRVYNNRK